MSSVSKRGNRRKSRRLRLPYSIGWRRDQAFEPKPEDWQRIEAAYGHELAPALREEIVAHVEKYFRGQPGEENAPFVDDALAYLNRLEKSGKKFWSLMFDEGEGAQTTAADYVQGQVGKYLSQVHRPSWQQLLDFMTGLITAMEMTRKQINDRAQQGFVEGSSWNGLVHELIELLAPHKLPVGLAKFDDPARAAPFVAFFRELQVTFPAQYQRHGTSNAALTEAITTARRSIKRFLRAQAQKNNPPPEAN
ncbi:hypothetical protein [Bradyrhizobium sp. WD16]|uniref:hypothetical protein n=1 Tax=Bradyrhizobium sp. WD16 TaxID=1521768 RepID=UPI0020A2F448|nr:hypothetical protein [Bradyrhizobium sp. WD16]UTD29348.1 hypothetical protein DB459_22975 [Bradyrhizobium sp. WD16]